MGNQWRSDSPLVNKVLVFPEGSIGDVRPVDTVGDVRVFRSWQDPRSLERRHTGPVLPGDHGRPQHVIADLGERGWHGPGKVTTPANRLLAPTVVLKEHDQGVIQLAILLQALQGGLCLTVLYAPYYALIRWYKLKNIFKMLVFGVVLTIIAIVIYFSIPTLLPLIRGHGHY
jgi:hypothetical protein